MTAEPSTAPEMEPAVAALLAAATSHPDPWFAALAAAFHVPAPEEDAVDERLVAHLEAQVARGDYATLDVTTEDVTAPGPHGPVALRVYIPDSTLACPPLLVWCHGGAFLSGDLDMPEADATAREVAVRAGAVVVSVDYRLATRGVHFPVPHDDVLAVYEWATERFGPAVIGGASAGANLAAGVALRLRDEQRPPMGALLVYPLLHATLPDPSQELAGKLAVLPAAHSFRGAAFTPMVENYLGCPAAEAPPYAMPGSADLRGYPPTLVINCEYDGLRASGEAFVAALEAADVTVTQLLAPEVLHGHINSPWLPQAQQSYADIASWLRALFSTGQSSAN